MASPLPEGVNHLEEGDDMTGRLERGAILTASVAESTFHSWRRVYL